MFVHFKCQSATLKRSLADADTSAFPMYIFRH